MILAGDIGGTKTLLGLFEPRRGAREPVELQSFPTCPERTPGDRIRELLDGRKVERATLGVAGAVLDGRATGSNLPWPVVAEELAEAASAPVRLVNDLHAVALWLPRLRGDESVQIQPGRPDPRGAMGVIAPGTGMGEAMAFAVEGGRLPAPSEAGHIDFAPTDELQARWWRHLHGQHGHVSLERACSGGSLPALARFLAADRDRAFDPECAAEIEAAADPTPVIVSAGMEGRCEVCREALLVFCDMLAAAAGNLALQIVATGGIYLGGGLPPRLRLLIEAPRWIERFREKGRFRELMERIPVRLITDDRAGLLGAAVDALDARSVGDV